MFLKHACIGFTLFSLIAVAAFADVSPTSRHDTGTSVAASTQPSVTPLINAHAHNDYEHTRPLLDALDNGFCSIEADINLVAGDALLVAHHVLFARHSDTLQRLYLNPLRERAKQNGGRIYPGGPTVTLLIDLKTPGEPTWAALKKQLDDYQDILTSWKGDEKQERAVTVILTGGYPRSLQFADPKETRYAACDGLLSDLKADPLPSKLLVPLISTDWKKSFKWKGVGPMPESERKLLRDFTALARQQGRTIRFWGAPDNLEMWKELKEAGVDWINTDKLAELRAFLIPGKS